MKIELQCNDEIENLIEFRLSKVTPCRLSYLINIWQMSWQIHTVKLDFKELLNKEQIDFKELFSDYQLFHTINLLLNKEV